MEKKTVPLKFDDRVVGTATIEIDETGYKIFSTHITDNFLKEVLEFPPVSIGFLKEKEMGETRYYTVTEEREVKVAAESAIEASIIANDVFRDAAVISDSNNLGRVLTPVRVRDIVTREDY